MNVLLLVYLHLVVKRYKLLLHHKLNVLILSFYTLLNLKDVIVRYILLQHIPIEYTSDCYGNSSDLLCSLDQCTCMLLHKDLITSDFPWSQFCLVVEYEEDQYMEVCQRQNISYRCFSFSQAPTSNAAGK